MKQGFYFTIKYSGIPFSFFLQPRLFAFAQPPIEEDDQSLEGPSPPLSAGSFVQELFQAQYRYTLEAITGFFIYLCIFFPLTPVVLVCEGLLSPVHIAKSRATPLNPSSVSPYRSHCRTHGESWQQSACCYTSVYRPSTVYAVGTSG